MRRQTPHRPLLKTSLAERDHDWIGTLTLRLTRVPGPAFPNKFHTASQAVNVNIPGILLTIGYLTTPASVVGVSLSEYWAWVRYLHAISPDKTLTLSDDFASL